MRIRTRRAFAIVLTMLKDAAVTRPHPIPPARWPTRDEAAKSRLFQPYTARSWSTRTRTWVPAMVPWRATDEGFVTPDVLDWYRRFADGRPGVLVVEATGIRDVPSGPLLRAGHERFIPGLRELVRVVRDASNGTTKLFVQLIDFLAVRRRPEKAKFVRRFLELRPVHRERLEALGFALAARASESDVRETLLGLTHEQLLAVLDPREREALEFGARERITDLHLEHVRQLPRVLPKLFADASMHAREAGFDGVELHFAHAYTMASFLSRTNHRDDGYGGSLEGRLRLPLEVFHAVRERVGHDFVVGCRFLGDEVIAGGSRVEDASRMGVAFAQAGFDFLSVSKGGKFDDAQQPRVGEAVYPYTGPSGHECMPTVRIDGFGEPGARGPFGRNLPLAATIRAAVRDEGRDTPVVAAGGINSFELAEQALLAGECDFVAAARQSLADPDWWSKMERGSGAQIRRCIFTNYCEGLDQRHRQVTCQLWDRDLAAPMPWGRAELTMSADLKRRLIAPP